MLTSDLELLLEALQDALEVVELDVREQHPVEAHKEFRETRIRRLAPGLRGRRPHREHGLTRRGERMEGDHAMEVLMSVKAWKKIRYAVRTS